MSADFIKEQFERVNDIAQAGIDSGITIGRRMGMIDAAKLCNDNGFEEAAAFILKSIPSVIESKRPA